MISIFIPSDDNYFKTFAEGVFVSQQFFEGQVEITLDDNYCFNLYYTFPHHARVYICCSTEKNRINHISIYNVNKEFAVLCKLEGRRSFDRYKESMNYLKKITKGEFYKLPTQFFWQLAQLCKTGKNSNYNIETLLKRYKYDINIDKELLCSQKNTLSY